MTEQEIRLDERERVIACLIYVLRRKTDGAVIDTIVKDIREDLYERYGNYESR
jgi:hypothetical protein